MKVIKYVFSLEMFFALFLLVGVFKNAVNIGIDLTVVSLGGTIVFALFRLMKKPYFPIKVKNPLIVFLAFVVFIVISYYYTSSRLYSLDKTIKLITLTAPAYIVPLLFFQDRKSIRKFLNTLLIVCLGIALYSFYKILGTEESSSVQGFVSINEGNYLGLGRALGVGAILVFIRVIFENGFKKVPFYLILLGLFIYTLMMTGGRMPLISAITVFLLSIPFIFRFKKGVIYLHKGFKKFVFLISMLVVTLYLLIIKGYTTTSFDRITVLFDEQGGGDSAHGRVLRYISALDLWKEHPFIGGGVGSFGLYFHGFDMRDYPHNMFLEVISEFGISGILILISLVLMTLGVGFLNLYKDINKVDTLQLSIVMVAIYLFANANISGDINDNRMLYTFMALCVFFSRKKIMELKKPKSILSKRHIEELSK